MQTDLLPEDENILDHPSLSHQLIAYIGNKRRLLPLIARAIRACGADGVSPDEDGVRPLFVDFFAGSGAVSRLGKLLGYHVIANDLKNTRGFSMKHFLSPTGTSWAACFRGMAESPGYAICSIHSASLMSMTG